MKKYIIGIIVLLFVTGIATIKIQNKAIKVRNANISRLESNWYNSIQQNSDNLRFILEVREINFRLKHERDSIAQKLSTKPKFIDKIVYQTIADRDTAIKDVPVAVLGKDKWLISDTGKCFTWTGVATLKNDSLKVDRTGYEYDNKITEVFYRKRCWFLGKRRNFVEKTAKCGGVSTVEFKFIR